MRPVERDAIAQLAAEQRVARHAERLRLGVEQRVLDRADRLRDDAARGGPCRRVKLGVDALVIADGLPDDLAGEPRDHGADAGRAEVLGNSLQPTMPSDGGQLDEMVVAPAGIAGERLDAVTFTKAPRRGWLRADCAQAAYDDGGGAARQCASVRRTSC